MKVKTFKQIRVLPDIHQRLLKTKKRKEYELLSLTFIANKALREWLERIEVNTNDR